MDLRQAIERTANAPTHAVRERRLHSELTYIDEVVRGGWNGRCEATGVELVGPERWIVDFLIRARGLIWQEGQLLRVDQFRLCVLVPPFYPLREPVCRFLAPWPYSPHVLEDDDGELPPRLRAIAAVGRGSCCYINSSDWTPEFRTHNLAFVVWVASRIATLELFHGEAGNLNARARDFALRMKDEGRLPLGPPLPYPRLAGTANGPAGEALRTGAGTTAEPVSWDV